MKVIEIQETNRWVSLYRGFLLVKEEKTEIGRIPLSDITALIFSAPGNMVSTNVLQAVQDHGGIIVFTNNTHHPSSIIWPIASHYDTHSRLYAQIESSVPLKKRLWKHLIKEKINNQSATLEHATGSDYGLLEILPTVKSGDTNNREALAARQYWKRLFGKSFRRNTEEDGINALLNYGYTVFRAAMARAVVATGLHPALGVHHHSKSNAFCLVDDLLEIYRPLVDFSVFNTQKTTDNLVLTPNIKKSLVSLLFHNVKTSHGISPVITSMNYLAKSYYKSLSEKTCQLDFPLSLLLDHTNDEELDQLF